MIAAAVASGQGFTFEPKHRLRRSQAQLEAAYAAGEQDVVKCENCSSVHAVKAAYQHRCKSASLNTRVTKVVKPAAAVFEISAAIENQPRRLQRNLTVFEEEQRARAAFFEFQLRWGSFLKGQLKYLYASPNCGCESDPLIDESNALYNPHQPCPLYIPRCQHGMRYVLSNPQF